MGPIQWLFSEFRYYWLAFAVVLVDQVVKFAVKLRMDLYEEVNLIGDTFSINFIENKGAAFGLTLADFSDKVGISLDEARAKLILTLFSIFAILVIMYLLRQVRHYRSALPAFLALILGGAIGNIIDRVFYGVWFRGINDYEGDLLFGRVVDMFYLDIYHGQIWGFEVNLLPVFNIADAAIFVGIVAVVLFQRRFFRQHQQAQLEARRLADMSKEQAREAEAGILPPDILPPPVSESAVEEEMEIELPADFTLQEGTAEQELDESS